MLRVFVFMFFSPKIRISKGPCSVCLTLSRETWAPFFFLIVIQASFVVLCILLVVFVAKVVQARHTAGQQSTQSALIIALWLDRNIRCGLGNGKELFLERKKMKSTHVFFVFSILFLCVFRSLHMLHVVLGTSTIADIFTYNFSAKFSQVARQRSPLPISTRQAALPPRATARLSHKCHKISEYGTCWVVARNTRRLLVVYNISDMKETTALEMS